jgi:divalent metal cation (Fe/Co/Zn/Cd) transporter
VSRRAFLQKSPSPLPADERATIEHVLHRVEQEHGVQTHTLRTRQAGARRFVSLHVLVPGTWTVNQGHQLLEVVEQKLRTALPGVTVLTYLESLEDPSSWDDTELDRDEESKGADPRVEIY